MKLFREDYTEEDLILIARRKKLEKQATNRTQYLLRKERAKFNVNRWKSWNREHRERKVKKSDPSHGSLVNLAIKRNKYKKNVMHKEAVFKHFKGLEKQRAELFVEETLNPQTKTILCLIGGSGVGKTLGALHLQYKLGANVICSYTTRPKRSNEIDGRDHYFVDVIPPKDQLLAYVSFGPDSYKYYALKTQVKGPLTVYVIDERGYLDLVKNHGDKYNLYVVRIERKPRLRYAAGVDAKRIGRDRGRKTYEDKIKYNETIYNNGTKAEFFATLEQLYTGLLNMVTKKYGWER